ncbi:DUF7693 family protein [Aquipseudomonas ullengensis]
MNNPSPLSAREVYQLLRDVALGTRVLDTSCSQCHDGQIAVLIDGWRLTLCTDGTALGYCAECQAPDGRAAGADTWQRFGTDPVQLLSRWEHEQLERLLRTAVAGR